MATETRIEEKTGIMTKKDRSGVRLKVIIALLTITLFTSCNSNNIYTAMEEIPDNSWSKYNKPVFQAGIIDTLQPFDIFITLRNTHNYPFRNIFFFVTTTSPDGSYIKDTIEYKIVDESGRWLGKGLGDIHDLSLPFKSNVLFPVSGTYRFRIEQGMRKDNLEGIMDIGIKIVKSE